MTVAIEIACSDGVPNRTGIGYGNVADYVGPVHFPERDLAAARVLKKNVGMTVAIEIACSDGVPNRTGIGYGNVADYVGPVHFPERDLAAARVLKKDVGGYSRWGERRVAVDHAGLAVNDRRAVGAAQVTQREGGRRGRVGCSRGRREDERVEFAGDRARGS